METWDAIRARRNVRDYGPEPLPDGALERILEAGRRAPSAGNRQPWDFVVVTAPERLAELATVWRGGGHVAGSRATVALVGPLVETQRERDWLQFDMGQAALQMAVAAADLGVGSCHSAIGDQALARRILGHPDDRTCIAMLSFGMPRARPLTPLRRPARRPFDDVVHRDRW
jgi:nitroreductase